MTPLRDGIDRTDKSWPAIKQHIELRIETLRNQLEGQLSETETANIRGRIAELRFMQNAAKPLKT